MGKREDRVYTPCIVRQKETLSYTAPASNPQLAPPKNFARRGLQSLAAALAAKEPIPWPPFPSSPAGLYPTPAACPLHKPRAAISAHSVLQTAAASTKRHSQLT